MHYSKHYLSVPEDFQPYTPRDARQYHVPLASKPYDIERVSSDQRNSLIGRLPSRSQHRFRRTHSPQAMPGHLVPRSVLENIEEEAGMIPMRQTGYEMPIEHRENFNYVPLISAALDRRMNIQLQKKISRAKALGDMDELKVMFFEFLPEMSRLSNDRYGNFVVQRLIESIDAELVNMLAVQLQRDLNRMATSQYGCRVVQRLILRSSADIRLFIMNELMLDVVRLFSTLYGCYVIQTIVETIPSSQLPYLLNHQLIPKVYELCTSQHSSHVMQHVFRFFEAEQKEVLTKRILENIVTLCKDRHANYVIQHLIIRADEATRKHAISLILPHIIEFAKNKSASNIIECCVKHANPAQNLDLLSKFLEEEKAFISVLRHKYGNFVVKSMLKFLPLDQRRVLSNALLKYFEPHNESLEELNVYESYLYKMVLRK